MSANIDIPTTFRTDDVQLGRDLSRLGSAVEQIAQDPSIDRVPGTVLTSGDATLALDKVTRLTPPPTGMVVLTLPDAALDMENHVAELVVVGDSSSLATIQIRAQKGSTVNGQASLLLTCSPYWYRFKRHGGNWYRG